MLFTTLESPLYFKIELDILIIILFSLLHLLFELRRSGFYTKINFYSFIILKFFLIQLFLIIPFVTTNVANLDAEEYQLMYNHFRNAFYITWTGYVFIWVGHYFAYRQIKNISPFKNISLSYRLNSKGQTVAFLVLIFIVVGTISYPLLTENHLQLRDYYMLNPSLRFIYNFSVFCIPFTLIYLYLKQMENKHYTNFIWMIFFLMLGYLLGVRTSLIEPLATILFLYLFIYTKKINIKTVMSFTILIFVLLYSMLLVRGDSSNNPISDLIYGNTFSDIRDFAWIMAMNEKPLFLGKTYISGGFSFIPSFLVPLRHEWNFGMITSDIVGYSDTLTFPGFRTGYFGESYFNFNIVGVVVLGLVTGIATTWFSVAIEHFKQHLLKILLLLVLFNFVVSMAFSSNFGLSYVSLLLFVIFVKIKIKNLTI